ncbi:MAG: hypothetical protein ACOX6O_05500 [Christensenellales bacterium]|jgi:hypothetical protein
MKNNAMPKKILLVSLLLAVVMLLSACNLIVKDPEVDAKQVIVSVNGEEVAKEKFTQYYNNAYNQELTMQRYYQQLGMIQQIKVDPDTVLENTLTSVARDLVMRQKAKELGLDAVSAEEEAKAQEAADAQFKDTLEQIKTQFFPDTELTGEELDKALNDKAAELEIRLVDILEDEKSRLLYDKLKAHAVKDVSVSDDEVQADFDQKVEQAKASYETNASAYGNAVNAGQTVYYTPAGYRFVKQILVKLQQEDQNAINALKQELAPLKDNLDEAQTLLTQHKEANGEKEDAEAEAAQLELENALKEAQTSYDAKNAELSAKEAEAYAAILPKANDIYALASAQDADFDALIKEYNEDAGQPAQGYAVFQDFTGFDEAFLKPAMALTKIGDVAEPSQGIYGYYIVQYAADIPEGPVALDSVRDSLHNSLLTAKQDSTYTQAGDDWVAAADVKTYPERMKD